MREECIEALVSVGREIEFVYKGYRYSITYPRINNESTIVIGRFNGKAVNCKDVDALLNVKIGKLSLKKIFNLLPDSAFDIL